MVKNRMGARLFLLVVALPFAAACSKSGGPSAPKTELAQATPARTESPSPASAGKCDPSVAAALLADVARSEAEKIEFEKTAKTSPAKTNFRKLYDAEIAFAATAETNAAKLSDCGAAPDTLAELKNKIAKSRANVTYLSESFPDFK